MREACGDARGDEGVATRVARRREGRDEDTEGFDARVLDSFLRSVSEFVSSVPVIVLLGLATSVSTLQGMLPVATAAMLNARAFQLWAPGKMMEAVQEEVLLSPERAPAFGSDVLNTLHTRFKEHDFSLAAVRRALHLLTLTHFMTKPLSAACMLLGTDPTTAHPDGEESDDEYGDAIDHFVRDLDADSVVYARRKYLTDIVDANDDDAATPRAPKPSIARARRRRRGVDHRTTRGSQQNLPRARANASSSASA